MKAYALTTKLIVSVFLSYFLRLGTNGDLMGLNGQQIRVQRPQKYRDILFSQGFIHQIDFELFF